MPSEPEQLSPPQPCLAGRLVLLSVIAAAELAVCWIAVGRIGRWGLVLPSLGFWAVGTAGLAWLLWRVLVAFRVRLDQDGVHSGSRRRPHYVAWANARLRQIGYSIYLSNDTDRVRIDLAAFCELGRLWQFIRAKVTPEPIGRSPR